MTANPKFINATAAVDDAAIKPFAASRKVYVQGSRADIRVPMREVSLSDTPASFGAEKNPALHVYDTSGPYTDPEVTIDIRSGLAALRTRWIEARADTELLSELSSEYGRARLDDPKLSELRFNLKRKPRRALPGRNVTQMHTRAPASDRDGVYRHRRISAAKSFPNCCCASMAGKNFGANLPKFITSEFVRDEVARGAHPANINHPKPSR